MAHQYIRLAEQPRIRLQRPRCSACDLDLSLTWDGWQCPSCGATWDEGSTDNDLGELPEGVTGRTIPNAKAWLAAAPHLDPDERDERITRLQLAETPADPQ